MTNGSEKIVFCTPLMEAVKVNHTGLVKLLIDNGAQVGLTESTFLGAKIRKYSIISSCFVYTYRQCHRYSYRLKMGSVQYT